MQTIFNCSIKYIFSHRIRCTHSQLLNCFIFSCCSCNLPICFCSLPTRFFNICRKINFAYIFCCQIASRCCIRYVCIIFFIKFDFNSLYSCAIADSSSYLSIFRPAKPAKSCAMNTIIDIVFFFQFA